MSTLSLVVVHHLKLKTGENKIRICIRHKGDTRYIITPFAIFKENQFKNGAVVGIPNSDTINRKLRERLNQYQDVLFSIKEEAFSCDQLKEILVGRKMPSTPIQEYWREYLDEREKDGRTGTAGLHKITLRYFRERFGDHTLFCAISPSNIKEFERHLLKKNLGQTTIGMHMKRLKVIINAAKKDGIVKYEIDPFSYYVMPRSGERELDISTDEFIKIRDYEANEKSLTVARDLFCISYYLGGINLVDLMSADLSGDTLTYIREKSKNTKINDKKISITIQPEAAKIINKWIGKNGKLDFKYKFTYDNFRKYVTRMIRTLAKKLEINKRVVYYSARKSFVQHGFELGIPLEILEYTIGHSMKRNRPVFSYVKIMRSHSDLAIRKIIDNLSPDK